MRCLSLTLSAFAVCSFFQNYPRKYVSAGIIACVCMINTDCEDTRHFNENTKGSPLRMAWYLIFIHFYVHHKAVACVPYVTCSHKRGHKSLWPTQLSYGQTSPVQILCPRLDCPTSTDLYVFCLSTPAFSRSTDFITLLLNKEISCVLPHQSFRTIC